MTVASGSTHRSSRGGARTATWAAGADAQALEQYLRMLAGPAPGARLLEIRFVLRHRDMGRLFIAAHSAPGACRLIRRLAERTDVYVGACLRSRRAGGRDAIDRAHLAYVEIDEPDAIERLQGFHAAPTMIVSSGSPGHAHAYFVLSTRLGGGARTRQSLPGGCSWRRSCVSRCGQDPAAGRIAESQVLAGSRSWDGSVRPKSPV